MLIDCDPGIDDALALSYAYAHPQVAVEGIVATGGNVSTEQVGRNVRGLLELLGEVQPHRQDAPTRAVLAQLVAQTPAHHFLAPTVDADMKLGNAARAELALRDTLRDAVLPAGSGEKHPLDLLPTEQHLLALAEAHATGASYLLLDEPTAGLDTPGLEQAAALTTAHCTAGGNTIIATHNTQLT